jgi:hypothetical protein
LLTTFVDCKEKTPGSVFGGQIIPTL